MGNEVPYLSTIESETSSYEWLVAEFANPEMKVGPHYNRFGDWPCKL